MAVQRNGPPRVTQMSVWQIHFEIRMVLTDLEEGDQVKTLAGTFIKELL
jgi:hypothetical protein